MTRIGRHLRSRVYLQLHSHKTMSYHYTTMVSKEAGLGNQTILAKIDKLRELNVGTIIPLPQVCRSYGALDQKKKRKLILS